jgi:hypothetical protein
VLGGGRLQKQIRFFLWGRWINAIIGMILQCRITDFKVREALGIKQRVLDLKRSVGFNVPQIKAIVHFQ